MPKCSRPCANGRTSSEARDDTRRKARRAPAAALLQSGSREMPLRLSARSSASSITCASARRPLNNADPKVPSRLRISAQKSAWDRCVRRAANATLRSSASTLAQRRDRALGSVRVASLRAVTVRLPASRIPNWHWPVRRTGRPLRVARRPPDRSAARRAWPPRSRRPLAATPPGLAAHRASTGCCRRRSVPGLLWRQRPKWSGCS